MTNTAQPARGTIAPVEHFAGSRHTRTTWTARVVMTDGSVVECGHAMHPTKAAAGECCRRLAERLGREYLAGAGRGD